jgi:hypothetical protein
MEVLKSERTIVRIDNPLALNFDESSVFLWVIHANKTPPHLGISFGSSFYSLKANGKDDGLSVDKILPVLKKKQIATVFYEMRKEVEIVSPELVFAEFETTVPGEVTCLEPLKRVFKNNDATWLKELLAFLEAKGSVAAAYGWQLPQSFNGIPNYNPQDIHRRLRELGNV